MAREGVGGVGARLSTQWQWETLRSPSPNRDFAYVARDKLTQMLKCHVFRCEAPAKNIATSLHEICSKARPPLLPGLAAQFARQGCGWGRMGPGALGQ